MDAVALSFAFSAGAASAFNPCGAALMPSYLAYLFLKSSGGESTQLSGPRRALQGAVAGGFMTLGFLVVFVASGVIVSVAVQAVRAVLPWLTIAIGAGLILLGLWSFTGRTPARLSINLPFSLGAPMEKQGHQAFFFYGLAFAVASLGCTLPVFMVVVAQTFSGGTLQGVFGFVVYALGMGVVVSALSVAVALARETAERWLHAALPLVERAGSVLIMAAGAYLAYYWIWGPGAGVR